MTYTIDKTAIAAIHDPAFEEQPGMCQRFVRQVIQSEYGSEFDAYHGSSAKRSAELWRGSEWAVDPRRGSKPGDILYYENGHGPNGHVAIRCTGNRVVENSTVHAGRRNGAKWFRSLEALGTPTLIVRLPPIDTAAQKNAASNR